MQLSVTEHLTIHSNRCLNGRGSSEFCRRCIDSCPRNAIDITADTGISFDSSQCTECALCISACPTEVFTHDGFIPIDFITLAKGKSELSLYCQASNSNQMKPDSLPIPCHGLLDDRLLVGLHTMGVKQLHLHGLDRCSSCLSRAGAQRLTQTLKMTSTTLKAHFPSLHDASENSDVFAVISDKNITRPEQSEAPMDRRNFLDGAVSAVAYIALTSLPTKLLQDQAAKKDLIAPEQNECMVKHLPQPHRIALLNLQSGDISIADTGDTDAWFHEVRDQGSCDACGICSLSCPTGALSIEDLEQTLKLNHQPAACIGCGLCSSLCPQQALQLMVVHDDATILGGGSHTLFRCEKLRCKSCGISFTHLDDHTRLCRSCESEESIRDQWIGEVS